MVEVVTRDRLVEGLGLITVQLPIRDRLFGDRAQRLVGPRAEERRADRQVQLLGRRELELRRGLRGGLLRSPALAGLPEVVKELVDGDAAGKEIVGPCARAACGRDAGC